MITISVLPRQNWQEYKTIQLEALKNDQSAFASRYEDWLVADEEKWRERPESPDTIICIAKDDEALIGLVGVHRENKEKAELWGMYVNATYRGQGIGKKLVEKILEEAKKQFTIQKIELMVNPDRIAAQALCETIGFRKIGLQKYKLGNGSEKDVVIMEKQLNS